MSAPARVVQPYLNFDGRCLEAIDFYKSALGAEVECVMKFKDAPEGQCGGGDPEKVMHAAFKVGGSLVMASDCHGGGKPSFVGISLSLAVGDEADAAKVFVALSDGGEVVMPLAKTFWSPAFGVVNDRFGVCWMVNCISQETCA